MRKKIHYYTDEPMQMGERVPDFLPPPSPLVKRKATMKKPVWIEYDSLNQFAPFVNTLALDHEQIRTADGTLPAFTEHGEQVVYLDEDRHVLCPPCANTLMQLTPPPSLTWYPHIGSPLLCERCEKVLHDWSYIPEADIGEG